jgi:hypothetical protein
MRWRTPSTRTRIEWGERDGLEKMVRQREEIQGQGRLYVDGVRSGLDPVAHLPPLPASLCVFSSGVAFTLVTPSDLKYAGILLDNLEEAEQEVPSALLDLASRTRHGAEEERPRRAEEEGKAAAHAGEEAEEEDTGEPTTAYLLPPPASFPSNPLPCTLKGLSIRLTMPCRLPLLLPPLYLLPLLLTLECIPLASRKCLEMRRQL